MSKLIDRLGQIIYEGKLPPWPDERLTAARVIRAMRDAPTEGMLRAFWKHDSGFGSGYDGPEPLLAWQDMLDALLAEGNVEPEDS